MSTREKGDRSFTNSDFTLTPEPPVELSLENVETQMSREQRLHQVEQFLKIKLKDKEVEYPDEVGVFAGYFKGVPSDIPLEDFADIVLFCALLTNNSLVNNFEFGDEGKAELQTDYQSLKKDILKIVGEENKKPGTQWLKKTGFISDDGNWVHLYIIDNDWGFNVGPDRLVELGIDRKDYYQRKERVDRETESYPGTGDESTVVSGGVEQRYSFTLFFSRLRDIYKGASEEQLMLQAKKIIKEMLEANFGFNTGGDVKSLKYYALYRMIEDEVYGEEEAKLDSLVAKWHEIEAPEADED